jgi:hypothetical protein
VNTDDEQQWVMLTKDDVGDIVLQNCPVVVGIRRCVLTQGHSGGYLMEGDPRG